MYERIFSLLVEKNEISWKSIILDLIRSEEMDPWDVDVSLLSQKYIAHLKDLQKHNLHVSGKVLLAAAILLRIKSNKLLDDDLNEFDRLIAGNELSEEEFYDALEQDLARGEKIEFSDNVELIPRTPQARRRKVSVYDLVKALEKALEVKQRRILEKAHPSVDIPVRKFDVTQAIDDLYGRISTHLDAGHPHISFSSLISHLPKLDKIHLFIPLLHLANQHKIDVSQESPFGDILISRGGENVQ